MNQAAPAHRCKSKKVFLFVHGLHGHKEEALPLPKWPRRWVIKYWAYPLSQRMRKKV